MIIIKAGEHCQGGAPPPENTFNLTNTVQFIYYRDGITSFIKSTVIKFDRRPEAFSAGLNPLFEERIVVHLVGELR